MVEEEKVIRGKGGRKGSGGSGSEQQHLSGALRWRLPVLCLCSKYLFFPPCFRSHSCITAERRSSHRRSADGDARGCRTAPSAMLAVPPFVCALQPPPAPTGHGWLPHH